MQKFLNQIFNGVFMSIISSSRLGALAAGVLFMFSFLTTAAAEPIKASIKCSYSFTEAGKKIVVDVSAAVVDGNTVVTHKADDDKFEVVRWMVDTKKVVATGVWYEGDVFEPQIYSFASVKVFVPKIKQNKGSFTFSYDGDESPATEMTCR